MSVVVVLVAVAIQYCFASDGAAQYLLLGAVATDCEAELEASGGVVVKQNEFFFNQYVDVAFPQYNTPGREPLMVFLPNSTAQVQAALVCMTKKNIPGAVKDGGHNYMGLSQAPANGISIALRPRMAKVELIEFNGDAALRVQGGATFEKAYELLRQQGNGLLIAGGLCPTVGIIGFTLGGGLGALTRKYGFGVDNVLQMEVVSTNGSVVYIANATQNADLFFALRGGGGPSFGVVTEMIIRLHKAVPNASYTFGVMCVPPNSIAAVHSSFAALMSATTNGNDFPDEVSVHWRLTDAGLCYFVYSLFDRALTEAALKPLLLASGDGAAMWLPGYPLVKSDYADMLAANAEAKGYARVFEKPSLDQNCVIDAITPLIASRIVDNWLHRPNGSIASCYVQGMAIGGSVASAVLPNATALPWRARVAYASDAECEFESHEGHEAAIAYVSGHVASLRQLGACRGAYLNFPFEMDPEVDYATEYWGPNAAALKVIREKFNPVCNNPLAFSQQVPLANCTPPPSPPRESFPECDEPVGAFVGIAVGGLVLGGCVVGLACWFCSRNQRGYNPA